MTDSLTRLKVLEGMIVEDARKASGLEHEDASIKALVERALIEAKGGLVKDPEPGSWSQLKAVPQDRGTKTECVRAAMAAITILESLSQAEVKQARLKETFRCLYGALAQGFVQADSGGLKDVLAQAMRSLQSRGLEKEWAAALYEAFEHCYDTYALGKLVAESDTTSNRVTIVKALQSRAGFAETGGHEMPRLLFEAKCGHALGKSDYTLRVIEANVIAYIKRMAQLVEWSLMTHFIHLDNLKLDVLYPDTIKVTGDLNRYGSTLPSETLILRNLDQNEKRVKEAWQNLEKPDGSACIIRLFVDGVVREIRLF